MDLNSSNISSDESIPQESIAMKPSHNSNDPVSRNVFSLNTSPIKKNFSYSTVPANSHTISSIKSCDVFDRMIMDINRRFNIKYD